MIENFESKITFEIPTNLDFDKLIRGNNYTLLWQNLHQQQQQQAAAAAVGGSVAASGAAARLAGSAFGAMDGGFGGSSSLFGGIDYSNGSSDYGLLNSLQSFANRGRDGLGVGGVGTEQMLDPTYERFIGDVWVGIVLTLMILSSIFCMCSCFLYHKFRQWQRNGSGAFLHPSLAPTPQRKPEPTDQPEQPLIDINLR
uniref:Uncharacterized protein n=1 Tax=Anopheles dirus TaxID=7168 RepID=A0A182MXT9_9DIPT